MNMHDIPDFHIKKNNNEPIFENHLTKLGLPWPYAKELSLKGVNTLRQLFEYYHNKNTTQDFGLEELENIPLKSMFEKMNITSEKADKIISIIRHSDKYYLDDDINDIIQQYDISDLYQMGLSKETSDKLATKSFYDLKEFEYYGDFVDILNHDEFIEVIQFLMNHGIIKSEEIDDFTLDLPEDKILKVYEGLNINNISLEKLKMRIYLSYLYLYDSYKPIIKPLILDFSKLTAQKIMDDLNTTEEKIVSAYRQFIIILQNPVKRKTLDYFI